MPDALSIQEATPAPGASAPPIRVLLISHTCQSPAEGQPKCELLHATPELDLRVLVPDRWKQYGQWRLFDKLPGAKAHYQVGKVRWPWSGPGQWYLHWYPELARTLREFQPDIIDLWEEPWGLVSAHACRLRARLLPGAKIICETEQNVNRTLPPPFERFRKYTLARADFLIGRNTEALEVCRGRGYAGSAEVVPNAVDAQLFHPLDKAACRRELGVSGFVVGYAGRLVEQKGLLDLVEAVAQCPAEVTAVLVGDGPLKPRLEARARDLGLLAGDRPRVRLLPGVPLRDLPAAMNAFDVFVLPSRTTATWKEQFGRVIIEAHACRIPVIGSDSGAIPEVVGAGGVVFPEGNVPALAAAITRLAGDFAECRRMGDAGYAAAHEKYTWQRVAARMAEIYHRTASVPTRK